MYGHHPNHHCLQEGPPKPLIASKVPRPEICEKYLQLMAEKTKQKELEEAHQAALKDEDDTEMAHLEWISEKQTKKREKAAAAEATQAAESTKSKTT